MLINYTTKELDLLARIMRAEALAEGNEGMLMVGNVVVNRAIANCLTFKDIRRDLTKFREDNSEMLKSTRNAISAHRDEDVCTQIEMIENIGLADAVQLIIEYEHILNELGTAVSPVKQLGICQLQSVFGK